MGNILLVEDDPVDALYLRHVLQRLGYDAVRTVPRGEEALEAFARDRFDAVLMDVNLAGRLDGVETAARINARSGLPVIYLTGNHDPAIRRRAAATRHWAILDKPVDPGRLETVLRRALSAAPPSGRAELTPALPGRPAPDMEGHPGRPGPDPPSRRAAEDAPPARAVRACPRH